MPSYGLGQSRSSLLNDAGAYDESRVLSLLKSLVLYAIGEAVAGRVDQCPPGGGRWAGRGGGRGRHCGDAIKAIRLTGPDLVVCDLNMPGGGGLKVENHVRNILGKLHPPGSTS
ncbi:MAG: hypothetical protein M3N28_04990 [Actinomycetota bacterium]|nr:hypothetical protein [Actinomycetota bacterium]